MRGLQNGQSSEHAVPVTPKPVFLNIARIRREGLPVLLDPRIDTCALHGVFHGLACSLFNINAQAFSFFQKRRMNVLTRSFETRPFLGNPDNLIGKNGFYSCMSRCPEASCGTGDEAV